MKAYEDAIASFSNTIEGHFLMDSTYKRRHAKVLPSREFHAILSSQALQCYYHGFCTCAKRFPAAGYPPLSVAEIHVFEITDDVEEPKTKNGKSDAEADSSSTNSIESLSEFRPPQFSEDAAWLPIWLQQCDVEQLNVEGIKEDHAMFEQRIEELHLFRKSISNGESLREDGGCNIGQLFLSGTDSSPFTFAQSSNNWYRLLDGFTMYPVTLFLVLILVSMLYGTCFTVESHIIHKNLIYTIFSLWKVVHFHLCLSSDGNSENTVLTTKVRKTESNFPLVTQPLENSAFLGQEDINLSLFHNSSGENCPPIVELEKPVDKNELLKHEENMKFSEAADDAAELCIAASEALVINDVIGNDSLAKPSASATLEASLQVKQARLDVWRNINSDLIDEISESESLSDLDDMTMESAYEDAGILFNELSSYELNVSRVKETPDSEYDDILKHGKTSAFGSICGKFCDDSSTHRMEVDKDNERKLKKDLVAELVDGDMQNKETGLGTDVGYHNDYSRPVEAQEKIGLSVSEENANMATAENSSHETNVSCSPLINCQDPEKEDSLSNSVQERFQSRWFGGWTGNNEVKHFTTMKHRIRAPFAGETSFLSESADAAPDENSFVQNHDKEPIIASQLSMPSENFSNRAKYSIMHSQDVVRSSSASFVDPLCSVVPCSISEDICSSPAGNHDNKVLPTIEHTEYVLGSSPSKNELAQAGRSATPIANIKESQHEVCRRFAPLSNYSKLLPSSVSSLGKDSCHQKRSFLINSNPELTLQETPFTNYEETVKELAELPVFQKENSSPTVVNRRTHQHFRASNCSTHNLAKENPCQTALQEGNLKCLPSENLQWGLLKCKNLGDQQFPAAKRVHFAERFQNEQNASKNGCSSRASTKPTRSTPDLESGAQQMNILPKYPLDKGKKRLILQNMEFLLTGFSHQKEKEIEGLIRKYGGVVISQIPSTNWKGKRSSRFKSQVLPVVLCLKKIQSFKFLYGCALNAYVLKANWLVDSIAAGFVLPPKRYMILSRNIGRRHGQVYTAINYDKHSLVFNNLGIMLHGKSKFFTNIATIIQPLDVDVTRISSHCSFPTRRAYSPFAVIDHLSGSIGSTHHKLCPLKLWLGPKHGGGQVFKTLQRLLQTLEAGKISMGVVVADDESCASRHLKHCALEQNVPMTSVSWIIKSLYAGKLVPVEEKKSFRCLPAVKLQRSRDYVELSQEI
ncbi:hypothetical protein BUALT_Bualt01G0150800 [Buddleja alternifolia]|uniref:BRCT domain-containing protein n=1 Tax=Buddleja alternifolia TaxID=168488 RepID=A0AAV6YFU0_9LAMI|nr:hypothetical protein BUALT_Bualt01G0150800 [Buddleja alternifolia]